MPTEDRSPGHAHALNPGATMTSRDIPLGESPGDPLELARALRDALDNLEERIEARAGELAEGQIVEARREATAAVADARRETERKGDLVTEMRHQINALIRSVIAQASQTVTACLPDTDRHYRSNAAANARVTIASMQEQLR